jgi:hypothetical protein
VQPYLISWLPIDPVAELARTTSPALVIQGGTDLQVGEEDARRLAAARPAIVRRVIPAMNHVLKAAPRARAQNLATYADPSLPLAPELVPAILGFITPGTR